MPVRAAEARVLKVLPHLLDKKGRHTLSPSLYERDAYQAWLRAQPAEAAGLRFDVQWKPAAASEGPLVLRVEARMGKGPVTQTLTVEQTIELKGRRSRWTGLRLPDESFRSAGDLVAWRVSLWKGDQRLASQTSFLW